MSVATSSAASVAVSSRAVARPAAASVRCNLRCFTAVVRGQALQQRSAEVRAQRAAVVARASFAAEDEEQQYEQDDTFQERVVQVSGWAEPGDAWLSAPHCTGRPASVFCAARFSGMAWTPVRHLHLAELYSAIHCRPADPPCDQGGEGRQAAQLPCSGAPDAAALAATTADCCSCCAAMQLHAER